MNRICGIYSLICPNGKRYIGKSVDIQNRFTRYKRRSCKSQPKIYNAITKYGWSNFKTEILKECEEAQLNELEKFYIAEYDSINNGYNCTIGGEGVGSGENCPNWKGGQEYQKRHKKEYREANSESIKQYLKKYRSDMKNIVAKKNYLEINKEKFKAKEKEYREANKDKIRETKKKRCKIKEEEIKKQKKEYREKNKEKIREYQKLYNIKKKLEKQNKEES